MGVAHTAADAEAAVSNKNWRAFESDDGNSASAGTLEYAEPKWKQTEGGKLWQVFFIKKWKGWLPGES